MTTLKDKKIAFIGAGFMGSAIIRGLIKSEDFAPDRITAADVNDVALENLKAELGIATTTNNIEAVLTADIVVMAVKPQVMSATLEALREQTSGRLFVSIAAGLPTKTIEEVLGGARVVRVMPNMGAAVGESATALCAGSTADSNDIDIAVNLFAAVGSTVVVEEKLMDAVTGLSGSGPAFVALFIDGMIDAGVRCGLARDAARTLALKTTLGAAQLMIETGESPAALKDRITSPGGTTIAGLALLEDAGFKGTIIRAIEEATARSQELGQ